jgi:two-component system sensor histidine kinase KdpD
VDRAEKALTNFFRVGNLLALRELALRHVTHSVDRSLESYLRRKHIDQNWGVSERVAVCISSNPASQQLIARGARMAHGLDAEFYVIHVETGKGRTGDRSRSLQANVSFAENLGAKAIQLKGNIVSTTVAEFVREHKITQVIFGRSAVHGLRKYLYLAAMNRFLANAPSVDVHIVTQEEN